MFSPVDVLAAKTTPVGFEPTRAEPTGLAGRRLNHSAKVSLVIGKHRGFYSILYVYIFA